MIEFGKLRTASTIKVNGKHHRHGGPTIIDVEFSHERNSLGKSLISFNSSGNPIGRVVPREMVPVMKDLYSFTYRAALKMNTENFTEEFVGVWQDYLAAQIKHRYFPFRRNRARRGKIRVPIGIGFVPKDEEESPKDEEKSPIRIKHTLNGWVLLDTWAEGESLDPGYYEVERKTPIRMLRSI